MSTGDLPRARVVQGPGFSWVWFIPALALVFAFWLGWRAWGQGGSSVRVEMASGHGIQAGDPVRYRDIQVGEVRSVSLSDDLARVVLGVRLAPGAASLARAGSRFWVVRPELSLEGVQGLETIVGARYLTVQPGPEGAPAQYGFIALDGAPPEESMDAEGLEVYLESTARHGLSRGAPVTYRGIRIGTVLSVSLSNDARSVEARVYVRSAYAALVRRNSTFHSLAGFETRLGLAEGFTLRMDSLRTLMQGGIGLSTPTEPGPRADTGQRFVLHSGPQEEWSEWRPALPVGRDGDWPRPEPTRVRLTWEKKTLFGRSRANLGWALRIDDEWVGLAELLVKPDEAEESGGVLELGGERFPVDGPPDWRLAGLAGRALAALDASDSWGSERTRVPQGPEDSLLVGDVSDPALALAAQRMREESGTWSVDASFSFDAQWHGACVLARSDGALLGFLEVEDGSGIVHPLPSR